MRELFDNHTSTHRPTHINIIIKRSDPDDDSDTEAVRNAGGKVAGVAPPPRPHDQLQHGAQPQPVNEKKLNQAMETGGESRFVKNKHSPVGDRTCLADAIMNILPKRVSRLLVN